MNRRRFLSGLIVSLAAPSIIRTPGLLMPVRPMSGTSLLSIDLGMERLEIDLAFMERISQRFVAQILYGNTRPDPKPFVGLTGLIA